MPPREIPAHVPVAVVTRGDRVESVHHGSVAVVDASGALLYAAGDVHEPTFTRSALKPLQALPFVRDGGPERFGYSDAQVALLCASHSGEARHVEAVAAMLAAAGKTAGDLGCGSHAPGYFEARGDLPPPPPYSPLAHNCSGKHAGMLAACALHGWRSDDYLAFDHPVQQEIRKSVASFSDVAVATLACGIDGCSAPNYAMPLVALARAFARLAVSDGRDPAFGRAPARLRDAMTAHPEMVSGEHRSDLALARAGGGDWIAKIGAEGVQAVGVRSRGIGIAVKIADGGRRALLPTVVAVLDGLGLVDAERRQALAPLAQPTIRNFRGTAVGVVAPVVVLARGVAPPGSLR